MTKTYFHIDDVVQLYNSDCIEGVKQHIDDRCIDLLIADPPFHIGEERFEQYYTRKSDRIIPGYIPSPENYYNFNLNWMIQAYRVLKPNGSIYVVSGWTNGHIVQSALIKVGFHIINEIIWQYNFPVYTQKKFNNEHYRIYYCKKGRKARPPFYSSCRFHSDDRDEYGRSLQYHDMGSVWHIPKEFQKGKKKNQNKLPDKLIRKILSYSSQENDLVADFFLGNGTTAIQAHRMNRRVIGFEKNPEAFKHIIAQLKMAERDAVASDSAE